MLCLESVSADPRETSRTLRAVLRALPRALLDVVEAALAGVPVRFARLVIMGCTQSLEIDLPLEHDRARR